MRLNNSIFPRDSLLLKIDIKGYPNLADKVARSCETDMISKFINQLIEKRGLSPSRFPKVPCCGDVSSVGWRWYLEPDEAWRVWGEVAVSDKYLSRVQGQGRGSDLVL